MKRKDLEKCIRDTLPPPGSPELKGKGVYARKRAEAMKKCAPVEKKQPSSKKKAIGTKKVLKTGDEAKIERITTYIDKYIEPLFEKTEKAIELLERKKSVHGSPRIRNLRSIAEIKHYVMTATKNEKDRGTVLDIIEELRKEYDSKKDPFKKLAKDFERLDKLKQLVDDDTIYVYRQYLEIAAIAAEILRVMDNMPEEDQDFIRDSDDERITVLLDRILERIEGYGKRIN